MTAILLRSVDLIIKGKCKITIPHKYETFCCLFPLFSTETIEILICYHAHLDDYDFSNFWLIAMVPDKAFRITFSPQEKILNFVTSSLFLLQVFFYICNCSFAILHLFGKSEGKGMRVQILLAAYSLSAICISC